MRLLEKTTTDKNTKIFFDILSPLTGPKRTRFTNIFIAVLLLLLHSKLTSLGCDRPIKNWIEVNFCLKADCHFRRNKTTFDTPNSQMIMQILPVIESSKFTAGPCKHRSVLQQISFRIDQYFVTINSWNFESYSSFCFYKILHKQFCFNNYDSIKIFLK